MYKNVSKVKPGKCLPALMPKPYTFYEAGLCRVVTRQKKFVQKCFGIFETKLFF